MMQHRRRPDHSTSTMRVNVSVTFRVQLVESAADVAGTRERLRSADVVLQCFHAPNRFAIVRAAATRPASSRRSTRGRVWSLRWAPVMRVKLRGASFRKISVMCSLAQPSAIRRKLSQFEVYSPNRAAGFDSESSSSGGLKQQCPGFSHVDVEAKLFCFPAKIPLKVGRVQFGTWGCGRAQCEPGLCLFEGES